MDNSVKQTLSVFMDDAAGELESRRLLASLDEDGRQTWARYQLAGAVLRGEGPGPQALDLGERVAAELAQEPVVEANTRASWWKPLVSVAVAASVTLVVILGFQGTESSPAGGAPPLADVGEASLAGPPPRAGFMTTRLGSGPGMDKNSKAPAEDIIRWSSSLDYYIDQYHTLIRERGRNWEVSWLPDGFRPVREQMTPDAELMLYSNGRSAISVSVEPLSRKKAVPGAVQKGSTLALGKTVGDQFVTVVGDLPLMIADRIAASVQPRER